MTGPSRLFWNSSASEANGHEKRKETRKAKSGPLQFTPQRSQWVSRAIHGKNQAMTKVTTMIETQNNNSAV